MFTLMALQDAALRYEFNTAEDSAVVDNGTDGGVSVGVGAAVNGISAGGEDMDSGGASPDEDALTISLCQFEGAGVGHKVRWFEGRPASRKILIIDRTLVHHATSYETLNLAMSHHAKSTFLRSGTRPSQWPFSKGASGSFVTVY